MAREVSPGIWTDRVRQRDGTRPWVRIEAADASAADAAFRALRGVLRASKPAPRVLTFESWVREHWSPSRRKRGLVNVDCDEGRLARWVFPAIGARPIAAITQDDLEAVVQALDTAVADRRIAWKSATCIWGLVTKAFDDACRAKDPALRVRTDNPAEHVRGPDRGSRRDKTILYPDEWLRVWRCEQIPIRWRRMIAVAIYTALRSSELRALRWPDVDMAHGLIHVHAQRRTTAGPTRGLKSHARAHHVEIEPALLPVLEALQREARDDRVLPMPPLHAMPTRLRRYLLLSGVTREELHVAARDATRKPLSWHDLRGTGLTWWAARGDAPMSIMQRAGHSDMSTTMEYVALAEAVRVGLRNPFPPLGPAVDQLDQDRSFSR